MLSDLQKAEIERDWWKSKVEWYHKDINEKKEALSKQEYNLSHAQECLEDSCLQILQILGNV